MRFVLFNCFLVLLTQYFFKLVFNNLRHALFKFLSNLLVAWLDSLLKSLELIINSFLILSLFLLLINCKEKISVILTVWFSHWKWNQVKILRNKSCSFLITSLLLFFIDSCKWFRNNGNKKIQHDYHVKNSAKEEQNPHHWNSNWSKRFLGIEVSQNHSVDISNSKEIIASSNKLVFNWVACVNVVNCITKGNEC